MNRHFLARRAGVKQRKRVIPPRLPTEGQSVRDDLFSTRNTRTIDRRRSDEGSWIVARAID